jgi:chorismate lyase / 3-hydroxybenzoate synthase
MSLSPPPITHAPEADHGNDSGLTPPQWIARRFGLNLPTWNASRPDDLSVRTDQNGAFSLVSVRVSGAHRLKADLFRTATVEAYQYVFDTLHQMRAGQPVRFWNFLPEIHRSLGGDRDRYMVFNAGRFEAFERRYGGREAFDQQLATASAVGHWHGDLLIHCLAAQSSGKHVENPRQIPPHRYSARFGPLPPCFARATLLPDSGLLLVGGTASICGEDSKHLGDLSRQFEETLCNLSTLISTAIGDSGNSLDRLIELRVYHPRPQDAQWLTSRIPERFPASATWCELLRADLCRSELLVEIEGVAQV